MKKILTLLSVLAMVCVFATPKAFADTHTLTVASSNPSSGVAIAVSPNDRNGQGNGTTQFTRSYRNSTSITLTAPATASGNTFQKWQRDGSDYSTNRTITFTLIRNRTMIIFALFTTISRGPAPRVICAATELDSKNTAPGGQVDPIVRHLPRTLYEIQQFLVVFFHRTARQ